jgi:glutamine synthetase
LFEKSAFARKAFGAEVHEHYTHFFRTEAQAYDKAVTDWERRRYFERI